jgi:hypothetical protein
MGRRCSIFTTGLKPFSFLSPLQIVDVLPEDMFPEIFASFTMLETFKCAKSPARPRA